MAIGHIYKSVIEHISKSAIEHPVFLRVLEHLILPVVGDDDPHEESESDHGAEEHVEVNINGIGRPHLGHYDVTQVNPT